MDHFTEQLVKKEHDKQDTLKTIAIIIMAFIGTAFLIFLGLLFPGMAYIIFPAICGGWYLTYRMLKTLSVEYEYIFTNGELDVDKIVGQSKRTRLLSINVKLFKEFSVYEPEIQQQRDYDTRIMATTSPLYDNTYCAFFSHTKYGDTLLIFNPNNKLLEYVIESLANDVKSKVKKQENSNDNN